MKDLYYPMIFKRKSFHLFRNTLTITKEEIENIENSFNTFTPLVSDIKTELKIVPAKETTCKRGEEYCILLYSENKPNYLANIGYIGEQLDLYLASFNIGALWFGIGKAVETSYQNLDYVIMIAIAKVNEDSFRKDMFKSKRKSLDEIWKGQGELETVLNIARFAPSACNTQPWIVERTGDKIQVFRYKKPGKHGIMPANQVHYYNKIDIGIFLCFLEICLTQENISFERTLYQDDSNENIEKTMVADYLIEKSCTS